MRGIRAGVAAAIGWALLAGTAAPAVAAPAAAAPAVVPRVCPATAPDEASAAVAAVGCGSRVEAMSGRSATSQVFVNPDGSATLESSPVPQRVQQANGSWAAVDTTLRARPDGSLVPTASTADVAFGAGGSAPFVTYRAGGATLTLSWPGPLPAPTVDGSAAVYSGVQSGVDLRVSATPDGFREVLVVRSAAAAAGLAQIRYVVGGTVTTAATPDGRLRFVGPNGATVAVTAAASMWDSSISPGAAGELAAGVSAGQAAAAVAAAAALPGEVSSADGPGVAASSAEVRVSASGGAMVLAPDSDYLLHAVFPVYVDPAISPGFVKWAYGNNINHNWDVGGKAWVGRDTDTGDLYRSFFDMSTTSGALTLKGKHILSAKFQIELWHSWSCGPTYTHLYRVGVIKAAPRQTWSSWPLPSPIWLSSAASNANKAGGCGAAQPDQLVEFGGLAADVQNAANGNWNTYSVALCACNSAGQYETVTDRWKKFYVDSRTKLVVSFNTLPSGPANLATSALACGGVVGTTAPVLQAQYVDADGADTLNANFQWQQLPSGPVSTVAGPAKPANNNGAVALSLGPAAEGKQYQWRVQTRDAYDSSPWSGWCAFTVNASAPPPPVVSSAAYPRCDPGALGACVAAGGPGVSAGFTFSQPAGDGADVVSYHYGWTNPPALSTTVAAGAAFSAQLTPPRYGLNTLYVSSVDTAGTPGGISRYQFLVNAPGAAQAYWPLDDIRGHLFTDQVSGTPLTPTAVTWTADARYLGSQAASFGATSQAAGPVPAFDTSGSFSVAAWARLSSTTCGGNETAVSVDGDTAAANNHVSGFMLTFDCTSGKWKMRIPMKNQLTPGFAEAVAPAPAVAGRWTFLVGVWDEGESKVRLYVNGALAAEMTPDAAGWLAPRGTGWAATGPVVIGRDRWNDTDGGRFAGQIADVRVYSRVLTADDLTGTDADPANRVPASTGLAAATQVGNWNFAGTPDCFCDTAPDGSFWARPMRLDAGWSATPPTSAYVSDSRDGNGALWLDGVAGSADTHDPGSTAGRPVLRTDQSLTISAWVRPDALAGTDQVVAREGGDTSAFTLCYQSSSGKWMFGVSSPDGAGGYTWARATADAAPLTGDWTHLVGVFDAATGTVTLYVDGVAQAAHGTGATGWLTTGSLRLGSAGTNGYFNGEIDQVQAWQGVLSAREIADLHRNS